jgi:hypothetical protein
MDIMPLYRKKGEMWFSKRVSPAKRDAIFVVRCIYKSVLKLKSWIIVSNRSSNSLKNLRALPRGEW